MSKKRRKLAEQALSGLFDVLRDDLSRVTTTCPSKGYARDRLMERMRKRAKFHNPLLRGQAFEGFISNNDYVSQRVLSLDSDVLQNARHFITTVLERYTKCLDPFSLQESLVVSVLFDLWRFGPGTSNGVVGTHAAEKIAQDMTVTTLCEPLVLQLRNTNPYLSAYDCKKGVPGVATVSGSRLTTVPKNETTERTIAIEPSGNMCLQLAAGMYLEGALRHIGLDIRTQQPKNKAMAKRGSLDGSLATIDMKSASDLIGTDLVLLLFPSEWSKLFLKLRSPCTTLPDGTTLEMSMISTMGNGFTFPLMTLIFVSLIYALRCRGRTRPCYIDWSNTAVFGDDIIIPTHEYAQLVVVLESAGFVINTDKSFASGPFRESCGGDFYEGYDVTPFYIESLATASEAYVTLNKVLEWCGRHEIVLFRTIRYLRQHLGKVFLVPEWHDPSSGLLTAQVSRRYKYLKPHKELVRLENEHFLMPLACGGYVSSGGGTDVFYSPRIDTPRMSVCEARLPKGYLDGWDPVKRSQRASSWVSLLVKLTE